MTNLSKAKPGLKQQLQQGFDDFLAGLDEHAKTDVTKAFAKLMASDVGAQALGPGDKAKDFTLPDVHGKPRQLSSYWQQGPVVLSFYRGAWWPMTMAC